MIELDPIIHQPVRLQIMASLIVLEPQSPGFDFSTLKARTGCTDGNLGAHLATLEQASLIKVTKAFAGRLPKTTVALTDKGRKAYARYLDALRGIVGAPALTTPSGGIPPRRASQD